MILQMEVPTTRFLNALTNPKQRIKRPSEANTPKEQTVEICLRYKATHLILSSTYAKDKDALFSYLHFIDTQLPKNVVVCLGGPDTQGPMVTLKRNLKLFNSIEEVHTFIQGL